MKREQGFTLLEILVALAVLAVALTSGIKLMQGSIDNQTHLKQRTLAQWVALNKLTEMQLTSGGVAAGQQDGNVQMAGQEWRWSVVITPTPGDEKVSVMEASVSLADLPDQVLAHQIGFVSNP